MPPARAYAFLAVVLLFQCAHHISGMENDDEDGSSITDGILSLDPDPLIVSFAALRKKHSTIHNLFEAYNRFHDGSKKDGGAQALGNQEVRALLKDVGLGNLAVRGELASLAIRVADSSGDGKVSEPELEATLAVVDCWLGEGTDAAVLAPFRRLASRVESAAADQSLDGAIGVVQEEMHGVCAKAIAGWWASGWMARLRESELSSPVVATDFARLPDESQCADALAARALAHAKAKDGQGLPRASRGQLRKALKAAGVDSLLVRHLLTVAWIEAMDKDKDEKLARDELADAFNLACEFYAAVKQRKTTVVAALRALSLPTSAGGFSPADFRAALASDSATKVAGIPAAQLATARAASVPPQSTQPLEPERAAAVAAAYVRLAPEAVLAAGDGGAKDEL